MTVRGTHVVVWRPLMATGLALGLGLGLALATPAAAFDPDARRTCHVKKLDAARIYGACRLKTISKAVKKDFTPDFFKCDRTYGLKWTKVEEIGGTDCLTLADEEIVREEIVTDTTTVASLLATGLLPTCGDGERNGREACDGADLGSATCADFGYLGGTLACAASCRLYDVTACTGRSVYPATGQTVSYPALLFGVPFEEPVPDDGFMRSGGPLAFIDNGDGTITDTNTGLMWEKKGAGISGDHNVDTTYAWSNENTGTIWDWIDRVNSEGGTGYAGYNDWRIPNRRELDSLVDMSRSGPSVSPEFHSGCLAPCPPTTCSCTLRNDYWSSTTAAHRDNLAWTVEYDRGKSNDRLKGSKRAVRAVRGP
jgi:hypothetical protein